jgi:hypothetical protein
VVVCLPHRRDSSALPPWSRICVVVVHRIEVDVNADASFAAVVGIKADVNLRAPAVEAVGIDVDMDMDASSATAVGMNVDVDLRVKCRGNS